MTGASLRQSQMRMASHLRNPEQAPPPEGVEERRLQIYRDLIFNHVEGFISGGFPVLRSLYNDEDWHQLVRAFLDGHRCQSPYFLEISQEFIQYVAQEHRLRDCDPPFLAEMAHYEWVELALDVAEDEIPPEREIGDLGTAVLRLSPVAWVLAYQFPVHRIGPGFQPEAAAEPSYLAVYRDRSDTVRFMELNGPTARLLELLQDNHELDFDSVLDQLAGELQTPVENIRHFALEQVASLIEAAIIVPA